MVKIGGNKIIEFISINHKNIETEHICCSISSNKDIQVMSKKAWLKERFNEGLVFLSSKKKMGFLSDPKYMKYKGFEMIDSTNPYFELLYLPFNERNEKPRFKAHLKETRKNDVKKGFTLYYTNQCPFTTKYVPVLKKIAENRNVESQVNQIITKEQAQNAPTPFTTFSLFYNDELVTHEILSEKKFDKILTSKGL